MKIRVSYVSNSSSSSFVVIGKFVGKLSERYKDIKLSDNKTYLTTGRFLNDGIDAIELNQEMFEYILSKLDTENYEELFENNIYEVLSSNEYETTISCKNLTDNFNNKDELVYAVHMDADYASSTNLTELKANYE